MMSIRSTITSDRTYHLLIWLLLIIPHGFFTSHLLAKGIGYYLFNILVQDGLMILITYLNIYFLIARFYKTEKYVTYFGWLILLLLLYTHTVVRTNKFIFDMNYEEESIWFSYIFYFFRICTYTVIGFLLFDIREKYEQKKKLDKIQLEKLQAEVNYLRAQINPHFLFNTMNNLYGLALEKSDRTQEVIIRLSKMMDYMLYELEGTKVLLKRDIENLENYIDLERIRQGNNASIKFSVNGEIDHQMIEPLLMLPLVENAFKHGVSQIIEGAYLNIWISVTNSRLSFKIKNNYKKGAKSTQQIHASIGLSNLKRRLELFYPAKHNLLMNDDHENYEVILFIVLS